MAQPQTDIHRPHSRRGITTKEIPWKWMPSLVFADSLPAAAILVTLMTLRRFGLGNADITFYIAIICLPLILRPWVRLLTGRIMASPKTWIAVTELIGATSLWATGYTLQSNVWMPCTVGFLTLGSAAAVLHSTALGNHYISKGAEHASGALFRVGRAFHAIALMAGTGVLTMIGGNLEVMRRNIPYSWASVFYLLAALTATCCIYHIFALPQNVKRLTGDVPSENAANRGIADICPFLLMTAESLFICVGLLFLIDAVHNGGQGLSPQEFGLAVGTAGAAASAAGAIGIDLWLRRHGRPRKTRLLTGVCALQCLIFLLMSAAAPISLTTLVVCMIVIGVCHGAGLMVLLTLFRKQNDENGNPVVEARKASAALMSAILALMISGTMEESMGYPTFFATILCVCTALSAATYLLARKADETKADKQ